MPQDRVDTATHLYVVSSFWDGRFIERKYYWSKPDGSPNRDCEKKIQYHKNHPCSPQNRVRAGRKHELTYTVVLCRIHPW